MSENNVQQKAICSWWNRLKGWGFLVVLTPDGAGFADALNQGDLFCHVSQLPPDHKYLTTGTIVSFRLGERNGKQQATKVSVIKEGSNARDVLSGVASR